MRQLSNEDFIFLKLNWANFLSNAPIYEAKDQEFKFILQNYQEPSREYHNLLHIKEALLDFEEIRTLLKNPLEIQMAIWYHDIIYDSTKSDNEERSGKIGLEKARKFGFSSIFGKRVHDLILVTKDHLLSENPDSKYFIDIDLGILGKNKFRFNEYERCIRKEYSQYPDEIYKKGRIKILKDFLGREPLYQTDYFRKKYEKNAKKNLQKRVEILQK